MLQPSISLSAVLKMLSAAFLPVVLLLLSSLDAFSPYRVVDERGTRFFRHRRSPLVPQLSMGGGSDPDDAVATGVAATNVLGTPLCPCCTDVGNSGIGTGFYRNGYCATGQQDLGRHTVCVQVTDEFLAFSSAVGNDLSTPVPQYLFPGLRNGDIWCLCAERWAQAYEAGKAPKVFLKATHEKTLNYVSFEALRSYAIDQSEADETLTSLNEQRDRLNKLF